MRLGELDAQRHDVSDRHLANLTEHERPVAPVCGLQKGRVRELRLLVEVSTEVEQDAPQPSGALDSERRGRGERRLLELVLQVDVGDDALGGEEMLAEIAGVEVRRQATESRRGA